MKRLALGIVLTTAMTLLLWGLWNPRVAVAGGLFGLLATGIHLAATAALKPGLTGSLGTLVRRWSVGMSLRLLGAVIWAVAATTNREAFPPLPTAIAFLGVLVPLLFMEIRLLK